MSFGVQGVLNNGNGKEYRARLTSFHSSEADLLRSLGSSKRKRHECEKVCPHGLKRLFSRKGNPGGDSAEF